MSTSFPTSLDNFTNPAAGDLEDGSTDANLGHAKQHADKNDATEALEAKVGIDGSAVTTSHDYKVSEVTGTDKAVGKTATQTLTNKTIDAASNTLSNIDNANIKTGAAIATAKLADDAGITTAKLANGAVTSIKLKPSSFGTAVTADQTLTSAAVDLTNANGTLVATGVGRAFLFCWMRWYCNVAVPDSPEWDIQVSKDGGAYATIFAGGSGNFPQDTRVTTTGIAFVTSFPAYYDVPSAGTYVFKIRSLSTTTNNNVIVQASHFTGLLVST